ncbi:hypothetical protein GCM10023215_26740 [Pseudonocardia yuanmonensis]|uniref:Mce-associated membrane protein n=1 Tax=Pseudonocardia yuanmonensis TaxID=1095914 RepID=A0ABP8WGD2_9PSEU
MAITSAHRGGRMTRRGASPPVPVWDGVVDGDIETDSGPDAGPDADRGADSDAEHRPTAALAAAEDTDEHPTAVLPAADGEEPAAAAGTDDADPGGEERPTLGGRGLAGLVALLVVTVLLLGAAITAGVFWAKGAAVDVGRENALSAARQTAVNLTTIDFSHAEDDVRRVLDGSTGDFGGLFTQNLDSYVGVVKDGEVVTTGEVTEAGIEKYDGETATAVVAVRTTVKNKTVPDGEQRFYRLVEQLEHQDGRWLVSRVEFVP